MYEENNQNFGSEPLNFDQDQQNIQPDKSLIQIIGPLNNEIFELNSALQSSKEENNKIKSDNKFLQSELSRLNSEVALLKSQIDQKAAMVSNLEKQKAEYETQLNTKSNEMKTEMSKLFDELSERRAKDDEYSNLEEEKQQMLKDIGIFEEHIYDVSREKESLEGIITDLRNEIVSNLGTIERMQEDAKVNDTYISDLTQQIDNANETNLSLKQSNETLQQENESLNSKLMKQSELISQNNEHSKEINKAFQDLRSRLEESEKTCQDLQVKLNMAKDENEYLRTQKSENDSKQISSLEFEKSELNSRIQLLESKLLLSSVKLNDPEKEELKRKVEELSISEQSLREQTEQLQNENETLRSEKNAFNLRISELEFNTAHSEELESYKKHVEDLSIELDNIKKQNDQLTAEKEELQSKCDSQNYEITGLQMRISEMEQNDENLQTSLNQTDLEYTNKSTEHLQEKRNVIQLQQKIHELDQTIAVLTNENSKLKQSNHQLIHDQLDLSQRIENISTQDTGLRETFEKLAEKTKENSQLKEQIEQIQKELSDEAANHLSTTKELESIKQYCYQYDRKLRDINLNYETLATSLSKVLNCDANNNSIIVAVSKLNGKADAAKKQLSLIENSREAQLKARQDIQYYQQEIAELNMKLDRLSKTNSILKSKLTLNGVNLDDDNSLEVNSGIYMSFDNQQSSFIEQDQNSESLKLSIKYFLQALIDTKFNCLQNTASAILDELNETNLIDASHWTELIENITESICKGGTYFSKLNQIYNQSIFAYNEKIDLIEQQLNSASNKIDQVQKKIQSQHQQKNSQIPSYNHQPSYPQSNPVDEGFVSRIPRKNTGMDYSKPTQSVFQQNIEEPKNTSQRTPGMIPQKKSYNLTPRSSQKKQQTPFRTPLAQLDASMTNTFEIDTPKLDLPRNTMSKIPVRFVPNGVAPPPTRNFH